MTSRILKIAYWIICVLLAIYIGNKICILDGVEALDYIVPYLSLVILILIVYGMIISYYLSRKKGIISLSINIAVSLTILIIIPLGFNIRKNHKIRQETEKYEQLESLKYLNKLKILSDSINANPNDFSLYVKRGKLNRSQGFYIQSIKDCEISLSTEQNEDAYLEKGWSEECIGRFDDALNSYENALKFEQNDEWILNRLEFLKRKIGK